MWKPSRPPIVKVYGKLRAKTSSLRQIVLIFLGVGINFSAGLGLMFSSLSVLASSPSVLTQQATLATQAIVLALNYFLIGVIYSTIASLSLHPKRIISPIYTQILTASFVPILIAFLLVTQGQYPNLLTFTVAMLGYFTLSLIIFLAVGIGQTPIVRYLVGLNGTKEDTLSFGLLIDAKLKDILKILRNEEVQYALDIGYERKISNKAFVFRTNPDYQDQFFISVVSNSDDENKTFLAGVLYEQTYYGISKVLQNHLSDMKLYELKKALQNANISFSEDNSETSALRLACVYALRVTESKLLIFRSLPFHLKAVGLGISLMTVLMLVLWYFKYITIDLFETFLVFAGLAVLFDFIPILVAKGRKNEID